MWILFLSTLLLSLSLAVHHYLLVSSFKHCCIRYSLVLYFIQFCPIIFPQFLHWQDFFSAVLTSVPIYLVNEDQMLGFALVYVQSCWEDGSCAD